MSISNQEAFDKVWNHFVVKGGACSSTSGPCLYRKNLKATGRIRGAVGVLIPNNQYSVSFEGRTVNGIDCAALAGADMTFLVELQAAHGSYPNTPNAKWKGFMLDKLTTIANNHQLVIP
jgi:hypothetical protein